MAENRRNNKKKGKNDTFSDQKRRKESSEKRDFKPRNSEPNSENRKPFSGEKRDFKPRNSEAHSENRKPFSGEKRDFKPRNSEAHSENRKPFSGEKRDFKPRNSEAHSENRKPFSGEKRDFKPRNSEAHSENRKPFSGEKRDFKPRNSEAHSENRRPFSGEKRYDFSERAEKEFNKTLENNDRFKEQNFDKQDFKQERNFYRQRANAEIRLNKYIAQAGICSRREADTLILSGVIQVNGKPVTELGLKIKPTDQVKYGEQRLNHEKKVYLLLNKPKDFITTLIDEKGRKTVIDLVKNACKERIFPIGRLDRNTTGVLLFTNDGDLAVQLTHPKFKIDKLYHVVLDKNIKETDLEKIRQGLTLEDGEIIPDEVDFVKGAKKNEVGIRIHSGRNHIVRRIFDHLGYQVVKLDRVLFGNLTKADLKRGQWRMLTPLEVTYLQQQAKASL